MNVPTNILLIDCPDDKGLVHKVTGVLYSREYNVLSNHEFVDEDRKLFFMRTEFVGTPHETLIADVRAVLPKGATVRLTNSQKRNIVVMATKEHHCLADLIIRSTYNELNARIVAIVANHEVLRPLVEKFEIPFHCISHEHLSREDHEQAVMGILGNYVFDYIVLAKYMRVLLPPFIERYRSRVINIHHSLLPAFVGAAPYKQAFERGVKIIGATSHFVTEELDKGPIIAQSVVQVSHANSASDMAQAGRDVEKIVLASALKLVLEDRVFLSGNKTIVFE
jgi:formyltetrahydrofolate deformylase